MIGEKKKNIQEWKKKDEERISRSLHDRKIKKEEEKVM